MGTFSVVLTAYDSNFTATLKKAEVEMMLLNRRAAMLNAVVGGLRTGLMAGAVSIAAMILPSIFATRAIGNFDEALIRAEAIEKTFSGRTQETTETIMKMATTFGVSSDEIAQGVVEFAKAGFEYNTVMKELMLPTTQLAIANQMDFATAARVSTYVWQLFGDQVSDATELLDMVNVAANESLLDVEDLGSAIEYAGSSAVVAGVKVEEFLAVIAGLSQIAFQSNENLGTLINRIMISGDELENILGATGIVVNGKVNVVALMKALQQMTITEETASDIAELWGVRSSKTFFAALKSAQSFETILASIKESNGSLQKQSEVMATSIPAMWNKIKESLLVSLREPLVVEQMRVGLEKLITVIESGKIGELLSNIIGVSATFLSDTAGELIGLGESLLTLFSNLAPLLTNISRTFITFAGALARVPAEALAAVAVMSMINKVLPYSSFLTIVAAAKINWYTKHVNLQTVAENRYLKEINEVILARMRYNTAMHSFEATARAVETSQLGLNDLEHQKIGIGHRLTQVLNERITLESQLVEIQRAAVAQNDVVRGQESALYAVQTMIATEQNKEIPNMQVLNELKEQEQKINESLVVSRGFLSKLSGMESGTKNRLAALRMESETEKELIGIGMRKAAIQKELADIEAKKAIFENTKYSKQAEYLAIEDRLSTIDKERTLNSNSLARAEMELSTLRAQTTPDKEKETLLLANKTRLERELIGLEEERVQKEAQKSAIIKSATPAQLTQLQLIDREVLLKKTLNAEKGREISLTDTLQKANNTVILTQDRMNQNLELEEFLNNMVEAGIAQTITTKEGLVVVTKSLSVATEEQNRVMAKSAIISETTAKRLQLLATVGLFSLTSGLMLIVNSKDRITQTIGAISIALGFLGTALMMVGVGVDTVKYGALAGAIMGIGAMVSFAGMMRQSSDLGKDFAADIDSTMKAHYLGGPIDETDIAKVHAGEYIIPASKIQQLKSGKNIVIGGEDGSNFVATIISRKKESLLSGEASALYGSQEGGLVGETGWRLIHEGELIIPEDSVANVLTNSISESELGKSGIEEFYEELLKYMKRTSNNTEETSEEMKRFNSAFGGVRYNRPSPLGPTIEFPDYASEYATTPKNKKEKTVFTIGDVPGTVGNALQDMQTQIVKWSLEATALLADAMESRVTKYEEAVDKSVEEGITSELEAINIEGMYESLTNAEYLVGPGEKLTFGEDSSAIAFDYFESVSDLPEDWAESTVDYFTNLEKENSAYGDYLLNRYPRRATKEMIDRIRGLDIMGRPSAKAGDYASLTGGWANAGEGTSTEVINNYTIDNSTNNFNEVTDEDLERYLELTGLR